MVSFFIDNASTVRRPISLSPSVARGATGTIHRVPGEPGIVVKLYTASKHMAEYREKIAAMLAAVPNLPPFSHHGRPYVQIAWPTGLA
jgi:DNA-binding helix-hairpin-helix protein with protein kinase domain